MFEYFSKEIDQIESEDLRMFVKFYLDEKVPSYFWKIGASSSGKFHPVFLRVKAVWFVILKPFVRSVKNF